MARLSRALFQIPLIAAIALSAAQAAGPKLPPAPYRALPVGTVLDYGSWKCTVEKSDGFETICTGERGERLSLLGGFLPVGDIPSSGYGAVLNEIYCAAGGDNPQPYVSIPRIRLDKSAQDAVTGLWPLASGKKASIRMDWGYEFLPIDVDLAVVGTKDVSIAGRTYPVFVITAKSGIIDCDTTPAAGNNAGYEAYWWFSPALGAVVKHQWKTVLGATNGYELKQATFPTGAKIARAAPAPAAVPRATATPAPVVKADTAPPVIDVPPALVTEGATVQIAGRVSDTSQVIEVTVNGRAVPLSGDGAFRIVRGVPLGSSTVTVTALDEWGNRAVERIKVTRKAQLARRTRTVTAVDNSPPVIKVPGALATDGATVQIRGRVTDASQVVEVTVNGRVVPLYGDGSFRFGRGVPVGKTTVTVAAVDEWGNRAEKKITVTRNAASTPEPAPAIPEKKPDPFAGIQFGKYHALVIGNNKYPAFQDLKTAVTDARAIGRLLAEDYGFDVTLLINATRVEVIDGMAKMRAELKYNDNLLIYYAGHGVIDSITEQGYWLPVDAKPGSPANWVSNSDITTMLQGIRARHVMVVADSCYSGTLVRAAVGRIKTAKERVAWVKRMLGKRGRTALVSGGLEPVRDSGGGQHSVFAKAFLDALRDNNSVMEGQALFDALKRPVVLNSNQTPQYSDIRLAGHEGGEFIFVRSGS